jgi:hypothetical protein
MLLQSVICYCNGRKVKEQIKLCPLHTMKFGGMEVLSPPIFTLELDGGEYEVNAAATLPAGEPPGIH